jgi:hypothetical protein
LRPDEKGQHQWNHDRDPKPLPKEGERSKIRDVLREAFSQAGESILVIVEEPERAK